MENFKYRVRSDLAIQNKKLKNTKTITYGNIIVKRFFNDSFNYTNIIFNNILTEENKQELEKILISNLKKYYQKYHITKNSTILVVGLGNPNITSDSLGPKTISKIIATYHLTTINPHLPVSKVATFTPQVISETGLSSAKTIKALTKELKPNLVIIIDSLVSSSIDYLNKLIEITDRGIVPGSGVSSHQEKLNQKNLKTPVVIIGVPTAIEASTIIKDALKIKEDTFEFKKGYDFIVSKKDIDLFIKDISSLIGSALNKSLNINIS